MPFLKHPVERVGRVLKDKFFPVVDTSMSSHFFIYVEIM